MSSFNTKYMSLGESIESKDEELDSEEEESEEYDYSPPMGHNLAKISNSLIGNRYKLIRKLGCGAFSTVWLSKHIKTNERFAIKIVKTKSLYFKSSLEEIKMLRTVQNTDPKDPFSQRIVKLINHLTIKGVNGRHRCLVFEVLGDSLYNFMIKSHKMGIPIQTLKPIVRQILEALNYLHSKCNLIHTDIKPENILLTLSDKSVGNNTKTNLSFTSISTALTREQTSNSFLRREDNKLETVCNFDQKLSDTKTAQNFDLGNACHSKGSNRHRIQTRPYRSPEVILGASFDSSADIWSTACTVFELATGELLFESERTYHLSQNEVHLGRMVEVLGQFPKTFRKGKFSKYFNKSGRLSRVKVKQTLPLLKMLINQRWETTLANNFANFLQPMLKIDPKERVSAIDCLSHQWLNT